MTGVDLPATPATLPDAQVAELMALAAGGAPHPDPAIRGTAVRYARAERRRRRGRALRLTVVLFATGAGLVYLVSRVGGDALPVPAWAVVGLLAGVLVAAVVVNVTERARARRLAEVEIANLRAVAEAAAVPEPQPLTLRYTPAAAAGHLGVPLLAPVGLGLLVWRLLDADAPVGYWLAIACVVIGLLWLNGERGELRPPVRLDPDGLVAPRSRTRVAWSDVTAVELLAPTRTAPLGRIVWRTGDRDRSVDVGDIRQPPEAVLLTSRAYLEQR